jgi:N-acetylmuramoyl-L-alanine amidase
MVKTNDKNFSSKWPYKSGLCIIACLGSLTALVWYTQWYTPPVVEYPLAEVVVIEKRVVKPVKTVQRVKSIRATSPISDADVVCLVENAYFEARNQGTAGIIGVIHVTLNRVSNSRYPEDICSVVYQSKRDSENTPIKNKCQFSWYCDGKPDDMNNLKIVRIVETAVHQAIGLWYNGIDITDGATHYHATYVNPYWNRGMQLTARLGDHKFYRERK